VEWEADGTGPGSRSVADFCVSSVEPSVSATTVFSTHHLLMKYSYQQVVSSTN
jgi:hypothetical protein